MKNNFRKTMAFAISLILIISLLPISAFATNSYSVYFTGYNVTIAEGTTGENILDGSSDYVTTLTVTQGYSIQIFNVYSYDVDGYEYFINYNFEGNTLTIAKEEITSDIYIEVAAFDRSGNLEDAYTTATVPTSFPYSEEIIPAQEEYLDLYDSNGDYDSSYAGKLYKIVLPENTNLEMSAIGSTEDFTDTFITLYAYDQNNSLYYYDRFDNDLHDWGEKAAYFADKDVTCYVFITCYTDSAFHPVVVEFSTETYSSNTVVPDLTTSASKDDEYWSWNKDTKTLVLKDGFESFTGNDSIVLPENAKIIVEGNAKISSNYYAIYALGNLDIELKANANLDITSTSDSGIYIDNDVNNPQKRDITIKGTPDSNGNLPILNIDSDFSGIITMFGDITIKNVDLNIFSMIDAIETDDGIITIDNCKVTIEADSDGIMANCGYDAPFDNISNDINITNSVLNIVANDEGIQAYEGNISLINCDTYIDTSTDEEGLVASNSGNIKVSGGRLIIKAEENAIETEDGKISLEDVALNIKTTGDYDLISLNDKTDFSIPGTFRMLDADGKEIYNGEWKDELLIDYEDSGYYAIAVSDGDSYTLAYTIVTIANGDKADNKVNGVKSEYTQGDKLSFTTIGGGNDIDYPVAGNTRWKARNWEVVGTELKGMVSENNTIDTSSLAPGKYTLKVNFEEQVFSYKSWTYYNNAPAERKDSISIEFVVAPKDTTPTTKPGELITDVPDNPNTSYDASIVPFLASAISLVGIWFTKKKDSE